MEQIFPIKFPLIINHPILLYQEQSEGQGLWSTVKYLEFQIPTKWDQMGETVDHRSKYIFNKDVIQKIHQLPQMQQNDEIYDDVEQNQQKNLLNTYKLINEKQNSMFNVLKLIAFDSCSEIELTYHTDVHYCKSFQYLAKKPYEIEKPNDKNIADYKIIFFKRQSEKLGMTVDIIGFHKSEQNLELILAFLLKQIVFEARYNKEGIKKQVEVSVDRVFQLVLKQIIRYIGRALKITQYETLRDLTQEIFQVRREDYLRIFNLDVENSNFCKNICILKRDIKSIVYKIMISEGLFPIHCEINTMNDPYIKLKLISLLTNNEVLPWSPKFHASLAIGNQHYSFTPNDLFNLRTLKDRKFNAKYEYIRIRILDFFPLDSWIHLIGNFFIENTFKILNYISQELGSVARLRTNTVNSEEEKQQDEVYRSKTSMGAQGKNKQSTFIIFREQQQKINKLEESGNSNQGQSSNIRSQSQLKPELNIVCIFTLLIINKKIFVFILIFFYQNNLVKETEMIFELNKQSLNKNNISDLNTNPKEIQKKFKKILKRSISKITQKIQQFEIIYETPQAQYIKAQIADEFYNQYHYELQITGILDRFCQIITETEIRSYSTFVNNCQTPVAAFIYTICDTFRPYGESLYTDNLFFQETNLQNQNFQIVIENSRNELDIDRSNNSASIFQENQNRKNLDTYHKFGTIFNSLNIDFTKPANLDQVLDYFGFYGDRLSSYFLKKMQTLDADQYINSSKQIGKNKQYDPMILESNVEEEIFMSEIFKSQQNFFNNYQKIIDHYKCQQPNTNNSRIELKQLLKISQIDQNQTIEQEQDKLSSFNIHNLLLNFQNKKIKMKQQKEKMASIRHFYDELFQEACFIYYNSIRIQILKKQRKNTLSYIGFLIAKDLDQFSEIIPQNITLQTLV